ELYQYVYRETKLASLFMPSAAVQTPEFVSRLEGRGAVALSFPAATNARLVLESDLGGQVTLAARDGIQLFRVDKTLGARKSVQLPPGRYQVTVSEGHRFGQAHVALASQNVASLAGEDLTWTDRMLTTARKGGSSAIDLDVSAGAH